MCPNNNEKNNKTMINDIVKNASTENKLKVSENNIKESENKVKEAENNIEIWEDLVNIKDLIKALIICIFTTFGGYLLAPNGSYQPLLIGLLGAIVGFITSSFLIKPKREMIEENKEP